MVRVYSCRFMSHSSNTVFQNVLQFRVCRRFLDCSEFSPSQSASCRLDLETKYADGIHVTIASNRKQYGDTHSEKVWFCLGIIQAKTLWDCYKMSNINLHYIPGCIFPICVILYFYLQFVTRVCVRVSVLCSNVLFSYVTQKTFATSANDFFVHIFKYQ